MLAGVAEFVAEIRWKAQNPNLTAGCFSFIIKKEYWKIKENLIFILGKRFLRSINVLCAGQFL